MDKHNEADAEITQNLLSVAAITKRFGTFTAVDEISFTVEIGSIVGMIGPNGAGKTTLLSMLVGLLPPTSGTITIDGMSFSRIPTDIKHFFGFVPDSQDVLNNLTGWEYLEFVRRIYKLADEEWQVVNDYLSLLHMEIKVHHLLETYSHGQRKKIQLIASLLHQPSLLILDEPFSGLDPEMVALSKRLLRKLRDRGVGILLSTHDLLMAEDLCSKVFLMNHGHIIATGSSQQLLETYEVETLEDAFLKAMGLEKHEEDLERVLANF